jgi:hypothetical protein
MHQALPKDAAPRLRFTLPETRSVLEVETEIAWADLKGYVGLRFIDLPASSKELLEAWLNQRMEEQIPGSKDKLTGPTPRAIQ